MNYRKYYLLMNNIVSGIQEVAARRPSISEKEFSSLSLQVSTYRVPPNDVDLLLVTGRYLF